MLSPDSGNQTVQLLGQISRQLAGSTDGANSNPLVTQGPSIAIIFVNAMWLMSLVLSLTSALLATLLQQWARRYTETPKVENLASKRARVRSFLFLGTQEYNMSLAVEMAPTLLHLSVLLFFAGLILFFFTIHKAVAIAVSVSVGVFAVMYVTLTILPYFGDKCPYRTPMSNLCWYPWHTFLAFATSCCHGVVKRDYWARLKNGFEESIIKVALDAPVDVDRAVLTRLFDELILVGKSALVKFVASIPEGEIVRIMTPPIDSGEIVLGYHLSVIGNCVLDTTTGGLDENERKCCLLVWLTAFHQITMEFINKGNVPEELLKVVRSTFADINHMQELWAHSDAAIRVISLSSCALLAKCLPRNPQGFNAIDLGWLMDFTGASGDEFVDAWSNPANLDHIIASSFVRGIFPHHVTGYDVPNPLTTYASAIEKTLKILLNAGDLTDFQAKLSGLIHRLEQHGDNHPADELHAMFPESLPATSHLLAPTPPAPSPPVPAPAPSPIPPPSLPP